MGRGLRKTFGHVILLTSRAHAALVRDVFVVKALEDIEDAFRWAQAEALRAAPANQSCDPNRRTKLEV
eukprot:CAMPEP_0174717104 /NCGR_PEP_ID=MMETSP1094-20130205/25861_1 /TAXON_ID=156173 /ORGANISM="Chrysochromulina brevifilum, Strain UTEX LB 985" /LENGTH=67 /DNA_ID=CAMNT_0015916995 /DNA_START=244 /DNA_END=447 /DNA_ORIENTATION=-